MAKSIPMHELKTLMGHSSITVTERFYTEPGRDLAARVRAAFATTA